MEEIKRIVYEFVDKGEIKASVGYQLIHKIEQWELLSDKPTQTREINPYQHD